MSIPQTINGKLIEKDITDNGPYEAEDDNADGYSNVNVNVKKDQWETTIQYNEKIKKLKQEKKCKEYM